MEKTITMSLEEYNKIINENEIAKKFLHNKNSVTIFSDYYYTMGVPRQYWTLITKNKAILGLIKEIEDITKSRDEWMKKANRLESNIMSTLIKKHWWQIF